MFGPASYRFRQWKTSRKHGARTEVCGIRYGNCQNKYEIIKEVNQVQYKSTGISKNKTSGLGEGREALLDVHDLQLIDRTPLTPTQLYSSRFIIECVLVGRPVPWLHGLVLPGGKYIFFLTDATTLLSSLSPLYSVCFGASADIVLFNVNR